ncbi:MMPL family transporter, partial [Mycobacterium colombiense]|uniref:MMPL family transporter n=1 Tax=Mycobacterium colombiense TaxID=339268 RepID=UPI000B1365B4
MSEPSEAPPRVDQPLIPPFLPRMIHRLALPILLVWLGIVFVTNTVAPQLEVVAKTHSVSMSPTDAASFQSMMKVGSTFKEFNSDNSAMILLEGDKPLGAEAHRYYDEIVRRVEQDKKHVQHVQDFWSDPLTAAGSQSHDQKAAYVQVYLAGNMGGGLANESAAAVRKIVDSVPAPPGIKAYVTGAGPLFADQSHAGEKGVAKVTLVTFVVIIVMLLFVYRSISIVLIMLAMVFIELAAARGVVATLGNYGVMGLSTFANNMLVLMAIAAGTDYAIFVVGRYHEARGLGETREQAFYTMFHSTAHVVLGSGLTIAGAMYCLSFCRR